jgi:hypothetical protein
VKISTPSRPIRICGLQRTKRKLSSSTAEDPVKLITAPRRCEQLLAQLDSDARIHRAYDAVSKRHFDLSGDGLHDTGQVMILPFARFHPRREIAQFAIIPIVREPHLGAYEQYLAVMDDHATVIYHVLVHYWPAAHGVCNRVAKSAECMM